MIIFLLKTYFGICMIAAALSVGIFDIASVLFASCGLWLIQDAIVEGAAKISRKQSSENPLETPTPPA